VSVSQQRALGGTSGAVLETSAADVISSLDLQPLFGTPLFSNGQLSLASYSPFLQLVPETAVDRQYLPVLAHYLSEQRIQTIPSQYTGLGSSSGSATAAQICVNSPRYLHYTVQILTQNLPLQAKTKLHTMATGQIINCANPSLPLAFRASDRDVVISSGPTLTGLIAILSGLMFHWGSWGIVTSVAGNVEKFTDIDPTSTNYLNGVYDNSLRSLVGDMCRALAKSPDNGTIFPTPIPTPEPTATATAAPDRGVPPEQPAIPAVGSGAGTAAIPLDPSLLVVPIQPPLKCLGAFATSSP
jgi:hypothetical protein